MTSTSVVGVLVAALVIASFTVLLALAALVLCATKKKMKKGKVRL